MKRNSSVVEWEQPINARLAAVDSTIHWNKLNLIAIARNQNSIHQLIENNNKNYKFQEMTDEQPINSIFMGNE